MSNDQEFKEKHYGKDFLVPISVLPEKVKSLAKGETVGKFKGKREVINGVEFYRIYKWEF